AHARLTALAVREDRSLANMAQVLVLNGLGLAPIPIPILARGAPGAGSAARGALAAPVARLEGVQSVRELVEPLRHGVDPRGPLGETHGRGSRSLPAAARPRR